MTHYAYCGCTIQGGAQREQARRWSLSPARRPWRSPWSPRIANGQNGLVLWDYVAPMPEASLVHAVREAGADDIASERLGQAHVLTEVCTATNLWLRLALIFGAAGIVGAFAYRLANRRVTSTSVRRPRFLPA